MKNPMSKIVAAALFCTIIFFNSVVAVSAQGIMVKAEASASQPNIGDNLTVAITLSNAQNVFGVDVSLDWNPEVLQLVSATPQLGVESHPGGVLHESLEYPIDIVSNDASQDIAEYHLLATSTGSSTPGFSGSGIIATVTFTVKTTGSTGLVLDGVELAIKGNVEVVTPSTSVDYINPIPEFPGSATMVSLLVAAIVSGVALVAIRKRKIFTH